VGVGFFWRRESGKFEGKYKKNNGGTT